MDGRVNKKTSFSFLSEYHQLQIVFVFFVHLWGLLLFSDNFLQTGRLSCFLQEAALELIPAMCL